MYQNGFTQFRTTISTHTLQLIDWTGLGAGSMKNLWTGATKEAGEEEGEGEEEGSSNCSTSQGPD